MAHAENLINENKTIPVVCATNFGTSAALKLCHTGFDETVIDKDTWRITGNLAPLLVDFSDHYRPLVQGPPAEKWIHKSGNNSASRLPFIDEIRNASEITACGHHHIGLAGASKAGRLVAELRTNGRSSMDLSAYSPNRFNDRQKQ